MAAMTSDEGRSGPGWRDLLGPAAFSELGLRATLTSGSARRWYLGAAFSTIWFLQIVPVVVSPERAPLVAAIGIALLVVYMAWFFIGVPISWVLPRRRRLLPALALFVLSFALFPWLGWGVPSTWAYVGVMIGMAVVSFPVTWALLIALGAFALIIGAMTEGWSESVIWLPVAIVLISAMMAAFGRNMAAMNALRATRDQMAAMAVEHERSRMARDLHDILGHSLTVITVKTELAGRLIDVDPARARTEISEVETLARGALADVRSTVAGYRGVSLAAELAAARAALDAAGIVAELPGSAEALTPERRDLAAWVVREGVTNVIRHANAHRCRVRLTGNEIGVEDDGVGPGAVTGASGTGLVGLRERVEATGGRLKVGRSELGGMLLQVTL